MAMGGNVQMAMAGRLYGEGETNQEEWILERVNVEQNELWVEKRCVEEIK